MTLKEALDLVKLKRGYVRCRRIDHGFNKPFVDSSGKWHKAAKVVICPIIQFYPKDSYLFESCRTFIKAVEGSRGPGGWLE